MYIGLDMAIDQVKAGQEVTDRDIWWALFCDALQTSSLTDAAPPRTGFPRKSAMPEAPSEVTAWQQAVAYLRGELEEMPVDKPTPPRPDAESISRAEAVLDVWHHAALADMGDWKRMRKALALRGAGVPARKVRKVRAVTGLNRQRLFDAKCRAMEDMQVFVESLDKRRKLV